MCGYGQRLYPIPVNRSPKRTTTCSSSLLPRLSCRLWDCSARRRVLEDCASKQSLFCRSMTKALTRVCVCERVGKQVHGRGVYLKRAFAVYSYSVQFARDRYMSVCLTFPQTAPYAFQFNTTHTYTHTYTHIHTTRIYTCICTHICILGSVGQVSQSSQHIKFYMQSSKKKSPPNMRKVIPMKVKL